jgi:hypothetical protein
MRTTDVLTGMFKQQREAVTQFVPPKPFFSFSTLAVTVLIPAVFTTAAVRISARGADTHGDYNDWIATERDAWSSSRGSTVR